MKPIETKSFSLSVDPLPLQKTKNFGNFGFTLMDVPKGYHVNQFVFVERHRESSTL
jgi:hypothetical protein